MNTTILLLVKYSIVLAKNVYTSSYIADKLATAFTANDIKTAGDLLKIGRQCFKKYRNIGKKSILALDDALAELGIKGW